MYGSNNVGLAALPATGMAMNSMWLMLAAITLIMLGLALMRLAPKREV